MFTVVLCPSQPSGLCAQGLAHRVLSQLGVLGERASRRPVAGPRWVHQVVGECPGPLQK